MTTYVTGPARIALGLFAGACVGAAAWAGAELITDRSTLYSVPQLALGVGAVALIVYAVGLLLLGAPPWALLHAAGCRGPASAITLGAVLNALVIALLGSSRAIDMSLAHPLVALAAPIGAVVGWVIWRIAYRRAA